MLQSRHMSSEADRKIWWLIYTVLVGLIPVMSRLLIWLVSEHPSKIDLFNAADFIAFGLILHISSINEIDRFHHSQQSWKTRQYGISIAFIVFYAVLFTSSLFGQSNSGLVNASVLTLVAAVLNAISFFLCFTVYDRSVRAKRGLSQ